ncbi:MAG: hypothetical protein ACP5GG_03445, partial [Conexivisphaera sp.]
MDRGFFAVDVLLGVQRMGIRFVVPAVANRRVKGIIEAYARGELPPVVEYRMGSEEGNEEGSGPPLGHSQEEGQPLRARKNRGLQGREAPDRGNVL